MMPSSTVLEQVLYQVSNFLNQNDLVALATTCRRIAERVAIPKLYENIIITKDVPLRSDSWYMDGGVTYLSGYRSTVKTEDQTDIYLYDRLERLCESQYLNLVKKLIIQQNVFYDQTSGHGKLQGLLDKLFSLDNVEWLDIQDKSLLLKNYPSLLDLSHSKFLRIYSLNDLNLLNKDCVAALRSVELILDSRSLSDNSLTQVIKNTILPQLEELSINDIECSSLRVFQHLCHEGVILKNLRSLKLNHVHSINNHKKELSELTPTYISEVVPFENIRRLELEFSCELDICDCTDTFLSSLSKSLVSLTELGLIEHNFLNSWKHDTAENWDLTIGKFILGLPQVGENMKKLSIRHHLPVNGIIIDGVEGNYNRRREIYQHILPKLESLETLVAPTFLQSISAYEVLVCDLLWNGCQCDYCKKVLDIYDDYILNHQYLCDKTGLYKDVIPTVFFAYSGDAFAKRLMSIDSWDTTRLHWAPVQYLWNMHGYNQLMHFNDYDCLFDESAFLSLGKCVTHFFNTYMDHLVRYMPNLRNCVLSGIYYQCYSGGTYKPLFD